MFRRSVVGLGALLGAFHLWLLGSQAWNGQLSDPDVVLRWIAGIGLGSALVALTRRGAAMFGRQTVAMWLLAALLHGPAVGNAHDGFTMPALPEVVTTVAQVAASLSAVGLVLAVVAALAAWAVPAAAGLTLTLAPLPAGVAAARCTPGFLPRPPPLA